MVYKVEGFPEVEENYPGSSLVSVSVGKPIVCHAN